MQGTYIITYLHESGMLCVEFTESGMLCVECTEFALVENHLQDKSDLPLIQMK